MKVTHIKSVKGLTSLEQIYATYDTMLGTTSSLDLEDCYQLFLYDNAILIHDSDNVWTHTKQCDLRDSSLRNSVLLSFLLRTDNVKSIIDKIPDDGIDEVKLMQNDSSLINETVALVNLLEDLHYIKRRNDRYYLSQDYDIDTNEVVDVYPLSYNQKLDIIENRISVYEYLQGVSSGNIQVQPDFQRNFVWSKEQQSRFIESIILNIPMPPIYLKQQNNGVQMVIDGLQRTTTLERFLKGKLTLKGLEALNMLNGKAVDELNTLDTSIVARVENAKLFLFVLQPSVPMASVYDLFNRINTGGTKLERQEIRNCIFIGKSTQLLQDIANSQAFKEAVGYSISESRRRDQEAVLRCLSFCLASPDEYKGSMDEHLESTMKDLNKLSTNQVNEIKEKTLEIFRSTSVVFGGKNFRIPTAKSRGRINVAVMETVFYCLWKNDILKDIDYLATQYDLMICNSEYLDSVKSSTSSKTKVKVRFTLAEQYLINCKHYD